MNLSKSRYCKGIQCPKMLWMDVNMPEQFDQSVMDKARLETGTAVGDLAMGYFGQFAEVLFSRSKVKMIAETRRLLNAKTNVIAEGAFSFKDNFCIADILRLVQDGYELIEVKSSAYSAGLGAEKVKAIYLDDMAYQTYVLTHCGLKIQKVCIMQLNRDYVSLGDLDIQKLFVLTDCTEQVFEMQQCIAANIERIKATIAQLGEPNITIGSRCNNPYECGYKGWCFRNLPSNNVFEIGWGMLGSKKDEAYNAGLITFDDVLNRGIMLSEKQSRQVATAVQNLSPYIDVEAVSAFLSKIKYPLYYLDFETCQQPVPLWDDTSPYEQIPFQYSLHIQDEPCISASHREFLAKEGIDPRRPLAERLCMDIPPIGACVLAYNMSFEKGCIKALAQLFPDFEEHLMGIHNQVIDLAEPFQSGAYYCREMGGSYSIKTVLPAMCPNDSALDYHALNLVHNGNEAMDAFSGLHTKSPEVIAETRAALLAYCKLDTLAMVKILEKLYRVVS